MFFTSHSDATEKYSVISTPFLRMTCVNLRRNMHLERTQTKTYQSFCALEHKKISTEYLYILEPQISLLTDIKSRESLSQKEFHGLRRKYKLKNSLYVDSILTKKD